MVSRAGRARRGGPVPSGCHTRTDGGSRMVPQASVLVMLVELVDRIPEPPPGAAGRGRPRVYSDRLFLKALVIMVVRPLPRVHTLLEVLAQDTPEMRRLRALLAEGGRYPSRRTWER